MKHIGSGLWAIAGAAMAITETPGAEVAFGIAVLILIFGGRRDAK